MNISPVLGKTFVFVGLLTAVALGICGLRSHWTTVKLAGKTSSITELDRHAQPFFDEAQKNIPRVVAKLTETKTLAKICWLEVRDKASGSQESHIEAVTKVVRAHNWDITDEWFGLASGGRRCSA